MTYHDGFKDAIWCAALITGVQYQELLAEAERISAEKAEGREDESVTH